MDSSPAVKINIVDFSAINDARFNVNTHIFGDLTHQCVWENFENKSHQSINTCGHFLILTLYLASLCRTCQHAKNIIKQKQNWFCSVRKANMQRRHAGTISRWESGSRGHPAGAAVGQHLSGETTLQPPFTPRLDMLHAYK